MERYIKDHGDKYMHTEQCSNCGETNIVIIQKGVRIEDAMRDRDCSACGCPIRKSNHRDYDYGHDRIWMQARKEATSLSQLPNAPTRA